MLYLILVACQHFCVCVASRSQSVRCSWRRPQKPQNNSVIDANLQHSEAHHGMAGQHPAALHGMQGLLDRPGPVSPLGLIRALESNLALQLERAGLTKARALSAALWLRVNTHP